MPQVEAFLAYGSQRTVVPFSFYVDSGASGTLAPLSYGVNLFSVSDPEIDSPFLAANGVKIRAIAKDVSIEIAGIPPVIERVYFSRTCPFGLLGQSKFFERFGVLFENFPQRKERSFLLFSPERVPPRAGLPGGQLPP